jgi:drug/metabolite transporter (DMT)-like permease
MLHRRVTAQSDRYHVVPMSRLSLRSAALLTIPPILWAGNAIVGRMAIEHVSPLLLNSLRWGLAFLILLPLGYRVLRRGSAFWRDWRYFLVIGVLGIGSFNALQYVALQTSTPINITLIASSMPVWMLAIGTLFYRERVHTPQVVGALLSLAGVVFVLSRGQWAVLAQLSLVPGDVLILVAVILWGFYSWMLVRPGNVATREYPWAEFLFAQMMFGAAGAAMAAVGEGVVGNSHVEWSPALIAMVLYVAIGPSLIAYRCWGIGVATAGPAIASFFNNLTPVFASLLSTLLLGDAPRWYHGVAFALIVGGIVVSGLRSGRAAKEH